MATKRARPDTAASQTRSPAPPAPAVENVDPFDLLRRDLYRVRIICNTLDALFRHGDQPCSQAEAAGLRDFVRVDLSQTYAIWEAGVLPLLQKRADRDREAATIAATLRGEIAELSTGAEVLADALDAYCATPGDAAGQSVSESVVRYCPMQRSLLDWLHTGVLSWLATRLDATERQALVEAIGRRRRSEPGRLELPVTDSV